MSFRASLRRVFSVHQKISPKLGCEGEFINCNSLWSGTSFLRYLKKVPFKKSLWFIILIPHFGSSLKLFIVILVEHLFKMVFELCQKWTISQLYRVELETSSLCCSYFFMNILKMRHHLIGVCTWDFWVTTANPDFREMVTFFTALKTPTLVIKT